MIMAFIRGLFSSKLYNFRWTRLFPFICTYKLVSSMTKFVTSFPSIRSDLVRDLIWSRTIVSRVMCSKFKWKSTKFFVKIVRSLSHKSPTVCLSSNERRVSKTVLLRSSHNFIRRYSMVVQIDLIFRVSHIHLLAK